MFEIAYFGVGKSANVDMGRYQVSKLVCMAQIGVGIGLQKLNEDGWSEKKYD